MTDEHNCETCNMKDSCEVQDLIQECQSASVEQHLVEIRTRVMISTTESQRLKEETSEHIGRQFIEMGNQAALDIIDVFEISGFKAYPVSTSLDAGQLSTTTALGIVRKFKHG